MMTCDGCRARLSAWLDGEAREHDGDIRAHLATCDRCRARADGLRGVSQSLRDPIAPTGLEQAVRRRVESRPRTLVRALSIAAVLVASLLWAMVLAYARHEDTAPVPNLSASVGLTGLEQRILAGPPPTPDEWMTIIMSGGPSQ